VGTVGRIVSGHNKGSFILIEWDVHWLDPEKKPRFIEYRSATKDFSGSRNTVWSALPITLEDVEVGREIDWLNEPPERPPDLGNPSALRSRLASMRGRLRGWRFASRFANPS
jgi:hypothetical protein